MRLLYHTPLWYREDLRWERLARASEDALTSSGIARIYLQRDMSR